MVITYNGETTFKIQSGQLSVVIDPANDRMKPDIILKTFTELPLKTPELNEIIGPGEYELLEVPIRGFDATNESHDKQLKTSYRLEIEEITIGILPSISNESDINMTVDNLGILDILFLPVGHDYINEETAAKIVKILNPKIVIPAYHKNPSDFAESLGQKCLMEDRLTIKKKEIMELGDSIKLVCLKV